VRVLPLPKKRSAQKVAPIRLGTVLDRYFAGGAPPGGDEELADGLNDGTHLFISIATHEDRAMTDLRPSNREAGESLALASRPERI
jgi:hypothetical protein